MKFSLKLMALMLGIVLAMNVLVFLSGYVLISEMREKKVTEELSLRSVYIVDQIDRFLFERTQDIAVFASNTALTSKSSTPRQIVEQLGLLRNLYNCYVSLSFFDLNRVRIADTAGVGVGEQDNFIGFWNDIAEGKLSAASDVRVGSKLKMPVIYFASPVTDEKGERFGTVVSRVPLRMLQEIIELDAKIKGESLKFKVDIVDKDGILICSTHKKKGVFKEKFKEDKEYFTAYAPERGFSDFNGNGWTVIVSVSKKESLAAIMDIGRKLIVILLPIYFFGALITVIFSRLMMAPVIKLRNATVDIARGNFDKRVEIKGMDEIGELTNAFNYMASTLKNTTTSVDNLNKEIEGRKKLEAELADKVRSLETFNKVAVDREMKMIELKKKVEELERRSKG